MPGGEFFTVFLGKILFFYAEGLPERGLIYDRELYNFCCPSTKLRCVIFDTCRAQSLQDRNFVAVVEFRTAQAVFPYFEGQFAALDLTEAELVEKSGSVGESKDRFQILSSGFPLEHFDQQTSNTMLLKLGLNR